MQRRLAIALVAFAIGSVARPGTAAEPLLPEQEPSLELYQAMQRRMSLSEDQRLFFGLYFAGHAERLRVLQQRLHSDELSAFEAMFEGLALRRDLNERAAERLTPGQLEDFEQIRQSFSPRFRALFFAEEPVVRPAWNSLLRSIRTRSPSLKSSFSDGENARSGLNPPVAP